MDISYGFWRSSTSMKDIDSPWVNCWIRAFWWNKQYANMSWNEWLWPLSLPAILPQTMNIWFPDITEMEELSERKAATTILGKQNFCVVSRKYLLISVYALLLTVRSAIWMPVLTTASVYAPPVCNYNTISRMRYWIHLCSGKLYDASVPESIFPKMYFSIHLQPSYAKHQTRSRAIQRK